MPPLSPDILTGLTRAKSAHVCCSCRHRCQNVNEGAKVVCPSFFTARFEQPHWRVPERFQSSGVWLCERHAKIVFPKVVSTKLRRKTVKPRKTVKQRKAVKQRVPAKRARAAPRECEASVAVDSGGAADSDDDAAFVDGQASEDAAPSDDGDGDASEDDHSAGDADVGELDGERVVDLDDSVAFERVMKKVSKKVKRDKKARQKMQRGESSGMTGVSDYARWRMVTH